MCLITLVPLDIEIPKAGIESGACSNPDGHGWVVASEKYGMSMGKSMNAEEAIEGFIKERERQGPHSFALFHSRLGTHGTKNLDNVHPFYVPDSTNSGHHHKTVVAHNGIMPSLWHPGQKDDRSDTRVFADRTATWYLTERGVPSRRGVKALAEMIGKSNKLVFLSTRMPGRPLVRIVNADSGTWEEGVWFSNDWFKRKRPASRPSYSSNTSGKMCADAKCKTTFYGSPGERFCYNHRPKTICQYVECKNNIAHNSDKFCSTHRPKVICADKDCKAEVYAKDETMCTTHRVRVTCSETNCNTEVRTKGEDKCYQHRPRLVCAHEGCTSDVLTSGETKCYTHRRYVSPYSGEKSTVPEQWNGYGIYPPEEIDDETQTLLEDIESTLEEADLDASVTVSDIDPDRRCEVCRTKGAVHKPTNLCLNCHWCLDCWVHLDDCTCFDYAKWLAQHNEEQADLQAALELVLDFDAETERLKAEAAEEEYLANADEEELSQQMREFYGITEEMLDLARKARTATEQAAIDAAGEVEPDPAAVAQTVTERNASKKTRGKAKATTAKPPTTNPTVTSGR